MANTLRIKRRTSGQSGAPTTLENAELAYNEVSDILYYGKGTGGTGGSATTSEAIGGLGAFLALSGTQTVTGDKTFSGTITLPSGTSIGSVSSTELGYVDGVTSAIQTQIDTKLSTSTASSTYAPLASPTFTGTVTIPSGASISGFAPLASPTFTGVPAAPTAAALTSTTQLATTAFVTNAVSNVTLTGTASQIVVTGTVLSLATNVTIPNDLVVTGDLTVQGNTTTLNTATLVVEDKNIVLANVASPTDTTANAAGITVLGATDKTLNWLNATSSWTSSENFDIVSGKVLKIAGTSVLSGTTLGSGIIYSSLTTLGTITTGVWTGTTIAIANGGTGSTTTSGARTALGVAIGSDVQAYSAQLTSLAANTATIDGGTF